MIKYRKSTYKKIFINYTIMLILIVCILSVFFYGSIVKQIKENNLYINNQITQDTTNYIKNIERNSRYIKRYLYQSNNELTDLIYFLTLEEDKYLEYRLDEFSKSNRTIYYGMDYFVSKMYELSASIELISVYSYSQNKYTEFYKNGGSRSYYLHNEQEQSTLKDLVLDEKQIMLVEMIKDPMSFEYLGEIRITYTLNSIDNYLINQNRHRIRILDNNYTVIYDSTNQLNGERYPFINDSLIQQKELEDKIGCYVNVEYLESGYIVIGEIDKEDATHVPLGVQIILILLSIVLITIGEISIYRKLSNLDKRMRKILEAMTSVMQGNFDTHIETDSYDDELTVITKGFNNMCYELGNYVQRSYLAEINQKNAELKALQSQINPHFSYNTLESIRMKAICNGDRGVGKMLQNLAIIFRSQIKESNMITLAKELHYCKKYIELFTFRYENQFHFDIVCEERYLGKRIIKFTLQPVIENYFVHGIRLEDVDNYIKIEVNAEESYIEITVEDNGHGMSEEKIERLNESLTQCKYDGKSMGIVNVHERIVMSYGKDYGLKVMAHETQGFKVVIRIPNEEEMQDV